MDSMDEHVPLNGDMKMAESEDGLKETPIEPPEEQEQDEGDEHDEEVKRIAQQAVETHEEEGNRWDTYFYKVVLGGNVGVVKQVVAHMEANNMRHTLDWLWQRAEYEESRHTVKKESDTLFLTRCLIFIAFVALNIILTPIFYMLHIFTTSLLNRQEKRLSGSVKLPLAYAAFSQSEEMMKFFLSQGVDIEHIDKQGNTVFHYISDLSATATDRAIEIFINTVKFIDDTDTVRKLLMHHRNAAGLTAVEYAAKFGSPFLLTQILKQPELLQHTPFAVSTKKVSFGDMKKPPISEANTKVELVDVSVYEAGSLANQSTILNFLSDRDIAQMSKEDLLVFDNTELIGKWVALKIKQMVGGVICFQVIDILITIILLFILSASVTGVNGTDFFFWKMDQDSVVQFQEIKAWVQNESYVFETEAFHNILHAYREESQMEWMKTFVQDEPKLAKLLFQRSFGGMDPDVYDPQQDKWTVSRNTLDQKQLDTLYDTGMTMEELRHHFSHLYVFRDLAKVLSLYAADLVFHKNDIFKDDFYMFTSRYTDYYERFSFTALNETVLLHSVLPQGAGIFGFVCVPSAMFTYADLRHSDENVYTQERLFEKVAASGAYDSCFYRGIMNAIKGESCEVTEPLELADLWLGSGSAMGLSSMDKLRITIVVVCMIAYLSLDFLERCIFAWFSMSQQTTGREMVASVLGRKVPGSYARKQLNITSYFFISYQFFIQAYLEDFVNPVEKLDLFKNLTSSGTLIFIIAIVVRFLMHIHAMRLLPGIGQFVITTFMMLTDLLHFSVVFGMVLFIFSQLLFILIDNPSCPIEKSEGFLNIIEAIFATFQLTFGHGEFDIYSISMPVKLTYVLYVVIVGLLLMNLIIAIMSTTATDIMAEPWKGALWQVEWLDEATSFEYTVSVLTLPFRCCPSLGYKSHKKAGFVTKKTPQGEWRIYVENFQCDPLK